MTRAKWLVGAAAIGLSACGQPDAGGGEDEDSSGGPSSSGTSPAMSSSSTASTDDSTSTGASTTTGEASTGGESSTAGESTSEASSSSGSTSTGEESCPGGPKDAWYGTIPAELVTEDPYVHDAGLAALVAILPTNGEGMDLSDAPVSITGAIFAIEGYRPVWEVGPRTFWIADANAHVRVQLAAGLDLPGLSPGDAIDLEVTGVSDSGFGQAYIGSVQSVTITAEDQPVWVQDGNEIALDYAAGPEEIFSAWGVLGGEAGLCGGSYLCYDFTHCGHTMTVRLQDFIGYEIGDEVQIVAPLQGGLPGRDDTFFNEYETDWVRILGP
jgi:hypothetical protein